MIEKTLDFSVLQKEFEIVIEPWIKTAYEVISDSYAEDNSKSFETLIEPIHFKINLSNFIKKTLDELISKLTLTETTIPKLFDIFIICVFKLKPDNQEPLFNIGSLYRAFYVVKEFEILIDTIKFIRNKLINGECDYNWVDIPTLDTIYRATSSLEKKKLKFTIRYLILLALREKSQKIKDIRI